MRRRSLIFTAAIVWLTAISLMSTTALMADDGDPVTGATPEIPTLTPGERSTAAALAEQRARSLLGGVSFRVADVGVWHTAGDLTKIGAILRLELSKPQTLSAEWPLVEQSGAALGRPYEERSLRYTAVGVTELIALVDLNRGTVVSLDPGPGAIVPDPPANARTRWTPTGN